MASSSYSENRVYRHAHALGLFRKGLKTGSRMFRQLRARKGNFVGRLVRLD